MNCRSIAIVGGGPAGAALATLCARRGHQVRVFEANPEPRPSVGESLLPYGHRVWNKLGLNLTDTVKKSGAVFYRKGHSERIDFSESKACPHKSAFQVDRRVLDPRLRSLAREAGAEFVIADQKSLPKDYDWVIDATGRRRSLGRHLTTYEKHQILRNVAFGSHFQGARLPPTCAQGDIAIVGEDGMWFWLIPLSDDLMSVGVVLTESTRKLDFQQAIKRSPVVQRALSDAKMLEKARGFSDFTETAAEFCGRSELCKQGWGLIGDAAFFLDPVFSSGVLFALESADRMCDVISGIKSPAEYQQEMLRASKMMENLVLGFYSGDFFELVFAPKQYQSEDIRSGVVGLLAGNLFEESTRAERMVARRLAGICELTKSRVPEERHLNAPIVPHDSRFSEHFANNESLIPA